MRKLVKNMCVLAIAAIATIVIMYNMASADNENQPPTMSASGVSTSEDTATINVIFGGDILGVTSGYIIIDHPDGISCSACSNSEKDRYLINNTNGETQFPFTFSNFSSCNEDEVEITFSIGGESSSWTYNSKSQGPGYNGAAMSTTARVTINKQNTEPVEPPVEEFKLDRTEISMKVGGTEPLPGNNMQKEVEWTSTDETVAKIDGNSVKGLKEGQATLTAETAEGESANLIVKVEAKTQEPVDPPEEGFKLNTTEISMKVGETETLPGNNKQKDVKWTSDDETVVAIDGNSVKGLKKGQATLTAETAEGESANLMIKVDAKTQEPVNPPVDNDPPKIGPDIMKLSVGDVATYGADKNVTWSSSDNSVAIINKSTGQVTAVGEGKATITAIAENGKTATAQIIVERKSSGGNETANPVISPSSDFIINAGGTYQLHADMEVEWTSLDETVATVDANGLVKGVGEGNTFIYAKSKDLRVSSIGVTVKGAPAKGNNGSTGGTTTNKTGNATTGNGNSSSTVNEVVPSTGETSTGTLFILGAVTLIVASVMFRKRMK